MTEGYWRKKVRDRDGDVCRMEISLDGVTWRECGARATQTAHVYRRHACGLAKFEPDVAIRACYDCHREFDGRGGAVRVPAYAEERANDARPTTNAGAPSMLLGYGAEAKRRLETCSIPGVRLYPLEAI